jgi:hypothetical protein
MIGPGSFLFARRLRAIAIAYPLWLFLCFVLFVDMVGIEANAGPNEDILAASKAGDRAAVEAALTKGASVNAIDKEGLSPGGIPGLTLLGLAAAYSAALGAFPIAHRKTFGDRAPVGLTPLFEPQTRCPRIQLCILTAGELDGSALKSSVAFTGRLACMTRAEAFEVVRQQGGTPSQAVTKLTRLLIVGELGWPLLDDGRPSNKLSRASSYGIPAVSERRFLEWIGKAVPDNVHKTYRGDQLAALAKLPHETVMELAQSGLLDERAGRFSFRDLASARQISKLLGDGVPLSEIIRSVSEIRRWLPDAPLRECLQSPRLPERD